ncbi:MAG: hypothetical protein KJ063_06585 [Anaerolineae bacterium]|nr:hypothetical protein [Anaerolineae bacterium]
MSQSSSPVLWHRLVGTLFRELLTPVNITVQTEVPLLNKPPQGDLLLIRREGKVWTAEQKALLPDGIWQNNARETLLEIKITESLGEETVQKTAGYDLFYRENQRLKPTDLATLIVSARRPRQTFLDRMGYQLAEAPGVYRSTYPIVQRVGLILLNELSDETHNAFAKCFASRKSVKEQAFQTLEGVGFAMASVAVMTFLVGLRQHWLEGEETMSTELTAEKVMSLGEKVIHLILEKLPPEERLVGLRPEERLVGLRPEERLAGLRPEEVLQQYRLEEIEAYLQKLKKQQAMKNGGVDNEQPPVSTV